MHEEVNYAPCRDARCNTVVGNVRVLLPVGILRTLDIVAG